MADTVTGADDVTSAAAPATGTDTAPADTPTDTATAVGRRGKVSKWDRPPPPHDWRFFVGTLGKVLLATGLLMFGFVAYQLWGTGLETARAQRSLENEFEELLAASATSTSPATTPSSPSTVPDEPTTSAPPASVPDETTPSTVPDAGPVTQDLPAFQEGDAVARIEIPSIGVDDIVVQGVTVEALKKGPGRFPDTPMPGQLGNAAIAGHRTTYGQPFRNVDDLVPGDDIVVTTPAGRFVYVVTGTQIVSPSDYEVVLTTDPTVAVLTLTSCHPVWSASQRIVISSELDETRSDPVGLPTVGEATPDDTAVTSTLAPAPTTTPAPTTAPAAESATSSPATTTTPTTAAPATVPDAVGAVDDDGSPTAQDAFAQGWFHDPDAFWQVALWGFALVLVSIGAWLLSRKTRHDSVGLLVGVVPFAIALFFFFQNVNRLLPPSL